MNVRQLKSNKISMKEAEKFFDNEDERYNVKMMIKDFMLPSKQTAQ